MPSDAPDPRPSPRFLSLLSLGLLAAALLFHSLPLPWAANRFDNGIAPVAAQRILAGDVPYVDFQTLYTPGWYHVTALAFRVFGDTYDVVTRLDTLAIAVQAWLAWHVAARLTGSRFAALLGFAAGLAFGYPYPSLSLAFGALLIAHAAGEGRSGLRFAAAGAIAGVAAWFRQDAGFAAAVAVAATALAPDGATSLGRRVGRAALAGASSAAALALLLLPAILGAPERLWAGLVVNPAATVPFRTSPDGPLAVARLEWIYGAMAILGCVAALGGLVRVLRRGPAPPVLAGVGVLAVWSLRYLVLRPDAHHLIPLGIVAGVTGAAALPRVCLLRLGVFAAACAAVAVPLARSAAARAAHALGRRAPEVSALGDRLPGASSLYLADIDIPDVLGVVDRIQATVPPGEGFLSACARHDRIANQDLLVQFLARRPAVPFDWHFDPGVTTREDVQRGIAADCDRAGIRTVLRWEGPSHRVAPEVPGASHVLDDWIETHFAKDETIGRYEIWRRR